jgi:cell division protein FtsA
MGGGTTEYVVYSDDVILHSGVLAVGGDHVTNDIAIGLKITLHQAEKLKREYGSALVVESVRDQIVSIVEDTGLEKKQVKVGQLHQIMSMRIEEVLKIIAEDLTKVGLTNHLRAGALICGGCAHVPDIVPLAERVLQMSTAVGHANNLGGLVEALQEPEFATAIGLVKYGALRQRKAMVRRSWLNRLKEIIKRLFAMVGYLCRKLC